MTLDALSPGQIPAGFTYFGQFIDHDLTFDKTDLMENVDISPVDGTMAMVKFGGQEDPSC